MEILNHKCLRFFHVNLRSRRYLKDKLKEVKFKCKCDLLIIYARNVSNVDIFEFTTDFFLISFYSSIPYHLATEQATR